MTQPRDWRAHILAYWQTHSSIVHSRVYDNTSVSPTGSVLHLVKTEFYRTVKIKARRVGDNMTNVHADLCDSNGICLAAPPRCVRFSAAAQQRSSAAEGRQISAEME